MVRAFLIQDNISGVLFLKNGVFRKYWILINERPYTRYIV